MITENQKLIIDALSAEIAQSAWSCAAEQHSPQRDPDRMDEYIRERKARMNALRNVRHHLEEIFTGVIL